MNEPVTLTKRVRKSTKSIKEDVYAPLDSIYRSARKCKNYPAALKAIELCLKAKKAALKQRSTHFNLHDLSDDELKEILTSFENEL
jgi:hypothetical protein